MVELDLLKKLEGKQTADTIAEELGITKQSAVNFAYKLKKEGFLIRDGGGDQKRIYTISAKFFRKKENPGMFEILNLHSPEKINPYFEHEPHGNYGVENAIIDLIRLNDIRIQINILPLFNHIKNWNLLYNLAKKNNLCTEIGALYDIARQVTKVRKMPLRIQKLLKNFKKINHFIPMNKDFFETEKKWSINLKFNKNDLEVYK